MDEEKTLPKERQLLIKSLTFKSQQNYLHQVEDSEVLFHCLSDHMAPLDQPRSANPLYSMLVPNDSPSSCSSSLQFLFSEPNLEPNS